MLVMKNKIFFEIYYTYFYTKVEELNNKLLNNKTVLFVLFLNSVFQFLFEPQHELSNNVVCVSSKASDQPAHMRSLIRAFASHLNIL